MLLKKILLALTVLTVCVPCEAHLDYPYDCCGNNDCGPIEKSLTMPNGDKIIYITTANGKHLSTIFPKGHTEIPSLDAKDHACILTKNKNNQIIYEAGCLFIFNGF